MALQSPIWQSIGHLSSGATQMKFTINEGKKLTADGYGDRIFKFFVAKLEIVSPTSQPLAIIFGCSRVAERGNSQVGGVVERHDSLRLL